MPLDLDQLEKLYNKATPGKWEYRAMGGASTVLCEQKPVRHDTGVPGFGYSDRRYCLGYVFVDDENEVRRDFILLSHDDAELIAALRNAAPELIQRVRKLEALLRSKDLYALLTNIQNDIDAPGHKQMANAIICKLDALKE
jgi:hypothetical protein